MFKNRINILRCVCVCVPHLNFKLLIMSVALTKKSDSGDFNIYIKKRG